MRPRLLLRTHYQADEPRLIIGIITNCTSAIASKDEDSVATALVEWGRANHYTISLPAAVYAIDNARHLQLIDKSGRWTHVGLAFGFIEHSRSTSNALPHPQLTVFQRRLYAKQYVENAGALLVRFGKWLVDAEQTTDNRLRDNNVIEQLVVGAMDEYLEMAVEISDRTEIRRDRDRLKSVRYSPITQRHKRYPLLTTMQRLGFIEIIQTDEGGEIIQPDTEGRLKRLVSAIPDARTLEDLVNRNALRDILHGVFTSLRSPEQANYLPTPELVANAYAYSSDKGLHPCSLDYIDDVLYASENSAEGGSFSGKAERLLDIARKSAPSDIRFHVDRRGQRAYVVIGDVGLKALNELPLAERRAD